MGRAAFGKTQSRRALLYFSLGFSAFIALLFADVVFGRGVISGRDIVPFFFPIEKAVHAAWHQIRVPLLLPEISFGRPLAANPNTGVFYPIRIALAALPFSVAFRMFPLIHVVIAGAGMFWFASGEGLSVGASMLAAVSFALAGPTITDTQFVNVLPGVALFPWILGAAARLCRCPGGRSACIFGFLLGLDMLAGDLFTSALAVGGAVIWTWCHASSLRRSSLWLAVGALAAILVAGIQIVPAIAFTRLTVRGLGRFPLSAALNWSLAWWRLLELFLPFPFGNVARDRAVWGEGIWYGKSVGFYQTLFCGTLAALGFATAVGSKFPHRRFILIFGTAALGLASLGFYLPKALLSRASPLPLRYPEKFVIGLTLVAALAAGILWDEVKRRGWFAPAVTAASVGILMLGSAIFTRGFPALTAAFVNRHWSPTLLRGALGARALPGLAATGATAWFVTAGILILLARGRRRVAVLMAVALLAADLGYVARSMSRVDPWETISSVPPSVRAIRKVTARGAFSFLPLQEYFSVPGQPDPLNAPLLPHPDELFTYLSFFTPATFGVTAAFNSDYDISDYYRVELARREMERDDASWSGIQDYLAAFSARAALVEAGRLPAGFPRPRATVRPAWMVTNPAAVPVVRIAANVIEVVDVRGAYDLIHRRRIDLLRQTVVETGRNYQDNAAGGHARVLEFSDSAVRCEVDSQGPGRLLIARAFSPFRDVLVDGRPAANEAADLCLTSVETPAGHHRVELVERLPAGAIGPAASLLGLAVLGLLWQRKWRERQT